MLVRFTKQEDEAAIWSVRAGETYALPRDMSKVDALSYRMGPDRTTFVAEDSGRILGTYCLRTNRAGDRGHVANCGYITDATATGRGVARRMCEHSLDYARSHDYRAMQINFVVSTGERTVRLWQFIDFNIVGRLPLAVQHPIQGYVDVLAMYRTL